MNFVIDIYYEVYPVLGLQLGGSIMTIKRKSYAQMDYMFGDEVASIIEIMSHTNCRYWEFKKYFDKQWKLQGGKEDE